MTDIIKSPEQPQPEPSKGGRPVKEIDWALVDKWCEAQGTLREIADACGVSEDTIERRIKEQFGIGFAEYRALHSATAKLTLRRAQLDMALLGSERMAIWLGKQGEWLGQKEAVQQSEINARLQVETNSVSKLLEMLDKKRLEMASKMISEKSLSGATDDEDDDEEEDEYMDAEYETVDA